MTHPVDPPDHPDMHRALDRISALAGDMAGRDIQLLRDGIDHAEETIRVLMEVSSRQHDELVRIDIEAARLSGDVPTHWPVESSATSGAAPQRTAGPVGHQPDLTGDSHERV